VIMDIIRSRLVIHIVAAIASAEIAFTLLTLSGVEFLVYPALAPVLIGLISETYDYIRESPRNIKKNIFDALSWVYGAMFFIGIELLKGY